MTFGCIHHKLRMALVACALVLPALPGAATEVDQELPPITLKDAQGNEHTLSTQVKRIYASGGRKSDKLLEAAFETHDQSHLDAQQAVVIADISSAPGFVKRIIRSSLKDRSYVTWTDTKGHTKRLLPYRENQVAVIDLDDLRITRIRHLDDHDALQALLAEASTPTPSTSAEPHPDDH